MKQWKIKPFQLLSNPFVLIGTFFGAIALTSAIIIFKPFEPRQTEQRGINLQKLSAVKNLKGTWEGKATFNTQGKCTWDVTLTLVINDQTENTISGTMTYYSTSGAPIGGAFRVCRSAREIGQAPYSTPVTGDVVGTRIENLKGGFLSFSGSYTNDTMTLDKYTSSEGVMVGVANLLKK